MNKERKSSLLTYKFLGADTGRTQDQWGKPQSLFERNFSLLKNDSDWFVLWFLSIPYILLNIFSMRTPAFASAPFKCYQTQRKGQWQSKKILKMPKDTVLLLISFCIVSDFTCIIWSHKDLRWNLGSIIHQII